MQALGERTIERKGAPPRQGAVPQGGGRSQEPWTAMARPARRVHFGWGRLLRDDKIPVVGDGCNMKTASPWSPLRNRLFRGLWIAPLVSNIGTWMNDVGAGWLMTSLSSSPSMVALVAAATSLPVMLLALPAGAIADIVDRRRLLIAVNTYFLLVIGVLALLTALGVVTSWLLVGLIFAIGIGTALAMPAWSAIVPELVPADELPSAIALNSIGINI